MFDFHDEVYDEYGERDDERLEEYIDGLMSQFDESAEASPVKEKYGGLGWAASMMEFAFNYIGSSPAKMTRREFEEVVFEIIPRKVSTEANQAEEIVAELRAFWAFVSRQYGATHAKEILSSLDDEATGRLRAALSNPANFGMAKSFFMAGKQSGFDMSTPEGLAEFQAVYNAKLLAGRTAPPPLGLTRADSGQPTGEALKKKRKEKKRQREAKKRNRR